MVPPQYPAAPQPPAQHPQAGYAAQHPQAGYPPAGYPQAGYPQAGYPQAGYPQAGYAAGYPGYPGYSAYPPPRRTNTLAIASLVCSVLGFTTGVSAIAGVICGHMALSQIPRTGEEGRSLAIAGLVIGYGVLALGLLVLVGWLLFVVALGIGTVTATQT
jgi:hypothetical protein